jgi:hypothetical protein
LGVNAGGERLALGQDYSKSSGKSNGCQWVSRIVGNVYGRGCIEHSDEEGMSVTLSGNHGTQRKEKRIGKNSTIGQPLNIKGLQAPYLNKIDFDKLTFVKKMFR